MTPALTSTPLHSVFRPITSIEDLPPIGAHETAILDFKTVYDKEDTFEIAKDVAAMANASGGTLLVGAYEDQAHATLGIYKPLAKKSAASLAKIIEDALAQRCAPPPLVSVVRIPRGGGEVIAVNIWPFPAQPVAVKVAGDKADGWGAAAWVFVVRIGTHTTVIRPEQLPMLMIPTVRRTAAMLSGLSKDSMFALAWGGGGPGVRIEVRFDEIDVLKNRMIVRRQYGHDHRKLIVPLDIVRTVWEDPGRGLVVLVNGQIVFDDKANAYHMEFPSAGVAARPP